MAEKRMFTMKIIDSDAFLDMPLSTQALYFHLNMRADDDGFINNPKRVQRMIGASDDDLRLLIAKRFVICFENGVIVIKHWRMHNTLRKDRYNPTPYQDELATLEIKDNNSYTEKPDEPLKIEGGNQMATNIQSYIPMTDNEYNTLIIDYGKEFVDSKIKRAKEKYPHATYKDISSWCEEDFKKRRVNNKFNNFQQRDVDVDALEPQLISNNTQADVLESEVT